MKREDLSDDELFDGYGPRTFDGEVVAAPRVLGDRPTGQRTVHLACDTHPAWMGCGLDRPDCVGFMATTEAVDFMTDDKVVFRVRDRRRLSYPRLRPDEQG